MTAAFLLKAPIPGEVKTRLAADIGNQPACEAYRKLVLRQLQQIPPEWKVHIFYTPKNRKRKCQNWLGTMHPFTPQPEGDLGDRQQAAVEVCLPDSVALIGGDCPYLTRDILYQVEAGLETHDLSLVPAVDGGYVTLAMKWWHPGLFKGLRWSTETVAEQLTTNASSLNASLISFNPLEDVDTIQEWQRACDSFSDF
ncbi:MAG: TIGR04282 family arsenosugar biosynthesis glycosyltransferase [Verrucomicrobiota bacterium]